MDNKVFRNFGMENEYLTSDKNQITDEVIYVNENDISSNNGLTRNNNSDKSLVILPLTIKDDLTPSNKLETVEVIDNNVVTKIIIAPSHHTPTQKSKKVTTKNIQMNYIDEKYSSARNTNIYNDGLKDININSSRSREKSNQDEIANHRQCNVDHNNKTIMKKKVDDNVNNNDRANLKKNVGCNKSKCYKICNAVDNKVFRNFGMGNNITHNIVENSNKSEDNIAIIRNDGKGEVSKVSVINAGDDIVTNVRHDTNNKLTIERKEENEETDDINTIQQESSSVKNKEKGERVVKTFHSISIKDQNTKSSNDNKGSKKRVTNGNIFDENISKDTNNRTLKQNILTTPIVANASNVLVNNTDDYIVKNFLQAIKNNHKIERKEKKNETEDINNIKSKREPICKNDYSLSNNTNDKLEYRYQLLNSPTSLKNETEIAITTTENKHTLKQSKLVSTTKKDSSVRNLVENNTNNNMIEKTNIKYISNHKDREDIQIKKGRNSSDFDKERTFSQPNDNNNTNNSKPSPFSISQSNHTPKPK